MKRTRIMPYILSRVKALNIKKYGTLTCEICHNPIEYDSFQFDHITPVSKYDRTTTPFRMNGVRNIQIACIDCNLSKSNKIVKNSFKTICNLTENLL